MWFYERSMGHFRVPPVLCFKTRVGVKPLIWKSFFFFFSHANKTRFHKKGCAASLILKVRVFGTRKWPIYHCRESETPPAFEQTLFVEEKAERSEWGLKRGSLYHSSAPFSRESRIKVFFPVLHLVP